MAKDTFDAALFDLTNVLQPIRRSWLQAAGVVLADFGLPMSSATTVILAARAGTRGIRQNVLAEEVGVNPGAMVRIIDQATQAGLLERHDSPDDRRVNTIHALPKGRELARKMEDEVTKFRRSLLGDLSPEEVATATRVLRQFESRAAAFLQSERPPK